MEAMNSTPQPDPAMDIAPSAEQPSTTSESKQPPASLDLVFCMDCTGSMGSYIASAKQNIETIVQKLIAYEKCDLRFGLVAYRDHPPQDRTYVTRVFDFVNSMRRMKANLGELSADGGGDGPEAVATGLYDSLHMPWRKDATKVVILISDAPPHGLGENGDGFPQGEPNGHDPIAIAHEMAREGITVYSVGCEPAIQSYRFARAFLCSVAEITSGQAVALSNAELLADVILGGAVEEIGLTRLMDEVQQEVTDYTAAATTRGEHMTEEDVARHVTSVMKAKGVRTKQMMTNTGMTDGYSSHLIGSKCLSEARTALGSAAPAAGAPTYDFGPSAAATVPRSSGSGLGGMVRTFFGIFGSSSSPAASPSIRSGPMPMIEEEGKALDDAVPTSSMAGFSAPRPMTEEVTLTDSDISYEQVKRMVHKVNVKSA